MKNDAYIKFILTVIAGSLLCIVLRDAPSVISTANAADPPSGIVKVQIVSIDESPYLPWEPLPVKMK